jgi:hypothetical protein
VALWPKSLCQNTSRPTSHNQISEKRPSSLPASRGPTAISLFCQVPHQSTKSRAHNQSTRTIRPLTHPHNLHPRLLSRRRRTWTSRAFPAQTPVPAPYRSTPKYRRTAVCPVPSSPPSAACPLRKPESERERESPLLLLRGGTQVHVCTAVDLTSLPPPSFPGLPSFSSRLPMHQT